MLELSTSGCTYYEPTQKFFLLLDHDAQLFRSKDLYDKQRIGLVMGTENRLMS